MMIIQDNWLLNIRTKSPLTQSYGNIIFPYALLIELPQNNSDSRCPDSIRTQSSQIILSILLQQ